MLKIIDKKYKINLTLKEIHTICNLENNYEIFNTTKLNMMSVLSYLIKNGADTVEGFKKSIKDIWNMYKRYHKNIKSLSNFKKIIYKLESVNLIFIEKTGKINTYHARKFLEVTQEVTQEVTHENSLRSFDMTSFESNSKLPNTKYINNNTITIIDNTVSETVADNKVKKSLAYEKAIEENNKDLVEPSELIKLAISKLKEQGRRSKKIIARLKTKLENRTNVVRKNVDKYLNAVIADAIAFYETGREKMALLIATKKAKYNSAYNLKKNKSMVATANFTQRKYDYDKLEKQLLGWDNSDDNCEIGTIIPTSTSITANFTQRQYDYDKLEKQLLGWDNFEDNYEIDVI